jgi:hypothetical protein
MVNLQSPFVCFSQREQIVTSCRRSARRRHDLCTTAGLTRHSFIRCFL